jgi:hypothetical protein
MWKFAQARLLQIQQSVKRLKFSKVGNKKGFKAGKKNNKPNKNKRGRKNRKNKKF